MNATSNMQYTNYLSSSLVPGLFPKMHPLEENTLVVELDEDDVCEVEAALEYFKGKSSCSNYYFGTKQTNRIVQIWS